MAVLGQSKWFSLRILAISQFWKPAEYSNKVQIQIVVAARHPDNCGWVVDIAEVNSDKGPFRIGGGGGWRFHLIPIWVNCASENPISLIHKRATNFCRSVALNLVDLFGWKIHVILVGAVNNLAFVFWTAKVIIYPKAATGFVGSKKIAFCSGEKLVKIGMARYCTHLNKISLRSLCNLLRLQTVLIIAPVVLFIKIWSLLFSENSSYCTWICQNVFQSDSAPFFSDAANPVTWQLFSNFYTYIKKGRIRKNAESLPLRAAFVDWYTWILYERFWAVFENTRDVSISFIFFVLQLSWIHLVAFTSIIQGCCFLAGSSLPGISSSSLSVSIASRLAVSSASVIFCPTKVITIALWKVWNNNLTLYSLPRTVIQLAAISARLPEPIAHLGSNTAARLISPWLVVIKSWRTAALAKHPSGTTKKTKRPNVCWSPGFSRHGKWTFSKPEMKQSPVLDALRRSALPD